MDTLETVKSAQGGCQVVVMTSRRIMRNVIIMSFVFFLNFVAYGGLASLQSSLHIDEGMGTTTQSVLYAAMVISCLFLPKLVISKLGHKWTVALSLLGYMSWMVANGYAVWGTMIPTCILVGVCASTLWTGQCSYFTVLARQYARQEGQAEDAVISLFFGVFFMIFQSSGLFGAIISSTVLRQSPPENFTGPSDDELAFCGINDCPDNNVTNVNLEKPPKDLVWTLVAIYISIAVAGFTIACVFIDTIPDEYLEKSEALNAREEVISGLKATVFHMRHVSQLLLIPLTIYSGLEQTFKGADWNKSYVTCYLGIWMVGFVSMSGSICNAITSFSGGRLVLITGRIPLFVFGILLETALIFTYALWKPDVDSPALFYVIPAFAGTGDGIWQTQINALYGSLFRGESEAAFSNYRLWESAGFVMAYAYSSYLCTDTKLYIIAAFLLGGMALYGLVEARERRINRITSLDVTTDDELAHAQKSGVKSRDEMKAAIEMESSATLNMSGDREGVQDLEKSKVV